MVLSWADVLGKQRALLTHLSRGSSRLALLSGWWHQNIPVASLPSINHPLPHDRLGDVIVFT